MAAGGWEEKASENRQRMKEVKAAEKVEVVPGVIVRSLRRFRATLTGPTQELPKWSWLRR